MATTAMDFTANSFQGFCFMARIAELSTKPYKSLVNITEYRETCIVQVEFTNPKRTIINERIAQILSDAFTAYAYSERA